MDLAELYSLWTEILARRLRDQPWGHLRALCDVADDVLSLDGSALSIHVAPGHCELPAASTTLASVLEEFQFAAGEGPGTDAVRSRRDVLVADLTCLRWRWPAFLEAALSRNVQALFSLPVVTGSRKCMATLTFYRLEAGTLSPRHFSLAHALQQLARIAFDRDAEALGTTRHRMSQAPKWVGHYHTVHLAAGILSVQHEVDTGDAFALMCARAFTSNRSLTDIANDVCEFRGLPD